MLCFVGIYAYIQYNRTAESLAHAKPQVVTTSTSMVAMYDSNEVKADSFFLGKIIEVSGIVSAVNNMQDTMMNVLLGDSNDIHQVSCLFGKSELNNLKNIAVGNDVSIKGICTGFLLDVEFNRCVLVERKRH
jgi:hypothetical protein